VVFRHYRPDPDGPYPSVYAGFGPEGTHTLVVGKALLGTDLDAAPEIWPLMAYAAVQSEFPSDSTADQWFDVDRYQGYLVLGRLVGAQMASESLS
jgi:hypothetical protein